MFFISFYCLNYFSHFLCNSWPKKSCCPDSQEVAVVLQPDLITTQNYFGHNEKSKSKILFTRRKKTKDLNFDQYYWSNAAVLVKIKDRLNHWKISSLPEKGGINTSHKQVRSSPLSSQLLPREFVKRLHSGRLNKSSGKFNSMFTEAY